MPTSCSGKKLINITDLSYVIQNQKPTGILFQPLFHFPKNLLLLLQIFTREIDLLRDLSHTGNEAFTGRCIDPEDGLIVITMLISVLNCRKCLPYPSQSTNSLCQRQCFARKQDIVQLL